MPNTVTFSRVLANCDTACPCRMNTLKWSIGLYQDSAISVQFKFRKVVKMTCCKCLDDLHFHKTNLIDWFVAIRLSANHVYIWKCYQYPDTLDKMISFQCFAEIKNCQMMKADNREDQYLFVQWFVNSFQNHAALNVLEVQSLNQYLCEIRQNRKS